LRENTVEEGLGIIHYCHHMLDTVVASPIFYGVLHKNGGSEGGRILRNGIAIVLQPCGQCMWEDERMNASCTKASKSNNFL